MIARAWRAARRRSIMAERSGRSRTRRAGAWTSAITSSRDALKSSIAALPSSPSRAQLATVTYDAASMVNSVKSFMNASNSKCS
jgi:hypothetical protein